VASYLLLAPRAHYVCKDGFVEFFLSVNQTIAMQIGSFRDYSNDRGEYVRPRESNVRPDADAQKCSCGTEIVVWQKSEDDHYVWAVHQGGTRSNVGFCPEVNGLRAAKKMAGAYLTTFVCQWQGRNYSTITGKLVSLVDGAWREVA